MKWFEKPNNWDIFILSVVTILITLHPFYVHGKINLYETGLYLPGIQSVLNGGVPYRDFFQLRGPLELYMPAILMKMFGIHIKMLYFYFYFGSVLCLILCIMIAKEFFKTRYLLYLMTPVLIGKTFPRVVFTYWGGMRFAFGLLAVWCIIKFFKREKVIWIFWAGIVSALGLLTSVEIGIYSFLGVSAALLVSRIFKLQKTKFIINSAIKYSSGMALILIPYSIYLMANQAFFPFIDNVYTIIKMQKDLHIIDPHILSSYPRNFAEAFPAMINPRHTNFRHMTPSYLYIFLLGYFIFRMKNKTLKKVDLGIICLGVYGFVMYITAFRGIWGSQFEMALQPEKILLFFLVEMVFLAFIEKKKKTQTVLRKSALVKWNHSQKWMIYFLNFCFLGLFCSSIGYSVARYNRRFFTVQYVRDTLGGKDTAYLKPFKKGKSRALNIERAEGVIVPNEQADELEAVDSFFRNQVKDDEAILAFPELGAYHFLFDRPFTGRFPNPTMSWFSERLQKEFIIDINSIQPQYIILKKEIPQKWKDVYLALEVNRKKYQALMDIIHAEYNIKGETPLSYIYQLKGF